LTASLEALAWRQTLIEAPERFYQALDEALGDRSPR
jgi:hypothetical protein